MIPYIEIPPLRIGTLEVHAFGFFVAAAVATGYFWMLSRSRRVGLSPSVVHGMAFWVFAVGFPVSIAAKWLYYPDFWQTLRTAPAELVRAGVVMSSFGGVVGGLAGGIGYLWARGTRGAAMWAYLDIIAWAFPRAFVFGRLGCSIAHDHPGIRTASWVGVQYPGGARYDLGLIEVVFLLALVAALAVLDRRRRPVGFFLGSFLTAYGIFRIALDRLHEDPPRFYGVTLDQWFAGTAILAGAIVLAAAWRRKGSPTETGGMSRRGQASGAGVGG